MRDILGLCVRRKWKRFPSFFLLFRLLVVENLFYSEFLFILAVCDSKKKQILKIGAGQFRRKSDECFVNEWECRK